MHGDKELVEKLGRNDPCPCGSGRHLDFNEALRRIAKTPKGLVVPEDDQKQDASDKRAKDQDKKKTAPPTKKGRG